MYCQTAQTEGEKFSIHNSKLIVLFLVGKKPKTFVTHVTYCKDLFTNIVRAIFFVCKKK